MKREKEIESHINMQGYLGVFLVPAEGAFKLNFMMVLK